MENKHTPGPWKPSFVGQICIGVQNGGSYGQMICNTILPEKDEEYEKEKIEIESNAKLIAAAPELLEACIEFCRKVECGEARSKRSYAQMKLAIKKATE